MSAPGSLSAIGGINVLESRALLKNSVRRFDTGWGIEKVHKKLAMMIVVRVMVVQ